MEERANIFFVDALKLFVIELSKCGGAREKAFLLGSVVSDDFLNRFSYQGKLI